MTGTILILTGDYHFYDKKRTGSKQDGLAMLISKTAFADISVESIDLEPRSCDRVAMVAKLTEVVTGRRIMILNTHLTVAHAGNSWDIPECRPQQMVTS